MEFPRVDQPKDCQAQVAVPSESVAKLYVRVLPDETKSSEISRPGSLLQGLTHNLHLRITHPKDERVPKKDDLQKVLQAGVEDPVCPT